MMDNVTPNTEQIQSLPAWPPEDRAEKCTMPVYWDMSEIMAPSRPARNILSQPADILPEPAATEAEAAAPVEHPVMHLDPFPEPRTVPSHWVIY